jgi:hypothetical protein
MKQPTTSYTVHLQEQMQINRDFLLSEGWKLKEDYPLFETFEHTVSNLLVCSIGLYGEFSICELHWCNRTPEREFSTVNPNLTKEDYYQILKLLRIRLNRLNAVQECEATEAK